jgi:hypothetical protein
MRLADLDLHAKETTPFCLPRVGNELRNSQV